MCFDASSVSLDLGADRAGRGVLHVVDAVKLLWAPSGILFALRNNADSTPLFGIIALITVYFDMVDQHLFDLSYLDLDLA